MPRRRRRSGPPCRCGRRKRLRPRRGRRRPRKNPSAASSAPRRSSCFKSRKWTTTRGGRFISPWRRWRWSLLLLLALSIWIAAVVAVPMTIAGVGDWDAQEVTRAMQHPAVLAVIGLGYVVAALAIGAVLRVYLLRDVWQRVADTATVYNLAAADNVSARGQLVSALGEGFADSLDVAGF